MRAGGDDETTARRREGTRRARAARRVPCAAAVVVALLCSFVAVGTASLPASASTFPAPPPPPFHAVTPARLLDTRVGAEFTTVDGSYQHVGQRAAFSTLTLTVGGRSNLPLDPAAVALNVTVTGPTGAGFVTVFPCGAPLPNASSVNVVAGQVVANAVVTKLGTSGAVCLYTTVATDLVVDVTGYFPAAATYAPLTPARLLETRSGPALGTVDGQFQGGGTRAAGSTLALTVSGRGGVPASPAAVSLNVTVTGPLAAGFVTVFPCGASRPNASNVNFVAGQVVANAVIAKVGSGGQVCLYTSAATDLVVDVDGSFPVDATFGPLPPARLLETRSGPGLTTVDGQLQGGGLQPAWTPLWMPVLGRGGVPVATSAVVLNVTVTEPTVAGFLTVFPCGSNVPTASTLNFVAGQVVANAVIVKVGPGGDVCLVSNVATHLVVDVNGAMPATAGWPSSRYDAAGTGFNRAEAELNAGNVSKLRLAGEGAVGLAVAAWAPPPVVSNGTVFVPAANALFAFSADASGDCGGIPRTCPTRAPLWSAALPGHRTRVAPTVANGLVYVPTFVNVPGDGSDELFVFDASGNAGCSGVPRTCAPLWTAPVGGSSPATVHGGRLYGTASRTLWVVDAAGVQGCSGAPKVCQPLWTAQIASNLTFGGMSAPAVDDSTVYAIDYNGTVYAYDAQGSVGCSGTPVVCTPRWTSSAAWAGSFLGWTGVVVDGGRAFRYAEMYVDGAPQTTVAAFDGAGVQSCAGAPVVCNPLWVAPIAGSAQNIELAAAYGLVFAVTANASGGEVVTALAENGAGCTTAPTSCPVQWSSDPFSYAAAYPREPFAFPVVANGLLYIEDSYGFRAFDATGASCALSRCYPLLTVNNPPNAGVGNLSVADGRAYVLAFNENVTPATATLLNYELCTQCFP